MPPRALPACNSCNTSWSHPLGSPPHPHTGRSALALSFGGQVSCTLSSPKHRHPCTSLMCAPLFSPFIFFLLFFFSPLWPVRFFVPDAGNWLSVLVGERRGESVGMDSFKAGASTAVGFVAFQLVLIFVVRPGWLWADVDPPGAGGYAEMVMHDSSLRVSPGAGSAVSVSESSGDRPVPLQLSSVELSAADGGQVGDTLAYALMED